MSNTRKKWIFIIAGILLAAAVAVVLLVVLPKGQKSEGGRASSLMDFEGSVQIERGENTLEAEKDMKLASDDVFVLGEASSARLKLDEDKFLYLDELTRARVQAEGTAEDSQTLVFIEEGTVMTEVRQKLSEKSSFLIVTPNTSTTIRGTYLLHSVSGGNGGLVIEGAKGITTNMVVLHGAVDSMVLELDGGGAARTVGLELNEREGVQITTDRSAILRPEDSIDIAKTGASVRVEVEELSPEDLCSVVERGVFADGVLSRMGDCLEKSAAEIQVESKDVLANVAAEARDSVAVIMADGT
ncbi:MAG: FecR domain-containing protein, partial [Clostridia bacterium]|nr:FecR domain-containing protein [Clostridia bacterium]